LTNGGRQNSRRPSSFYGVILLRMNRTVERIASKAYIFWPTLVTVYAVDFLTKRLVEAYVRPAYVPHRVFGDFVRLTLAYNKDAAMGLSLGGYSRIGFTLTAAAVLVVLGVLYRRTPHEARASVFALALITAGALGNLTDRLMSSLGVVDFIDVGIGSLRFYTFNVADAAVTCGALLLAVISLRTPDKERSDAQVDSSSSDPRSGDSFDHSLSATVGENADSLERER
jgi:signal peptidase II